MDIPKDVHHARVLHKYEKNQDDELNLSVGEYLVDVVEVDDGWCEGTLKGTTQRGMFPDNFVELIPIPKPQPPAPTQTKPPAPTQTKPPAPDVPVIRETQVAKKRRAKVTYSYSPDNEDELKLLPGQIVDVIEEIEEGWFEGSLNGKVGVFPSNFVEIVEETDEPAPPPPVTMRSKEKTRPPSMVAMPGLGGVNPLELKNKLKPVSTKERVPPPDPNRPPLDSNRPPVDRPRANTGSKSQTHSLPKAKVMFEYAATQDDEITVKEGDIVEIVTTTTDQDGWWVIKKGSQEGLVPDNFLEKLSTEKPPPAEPKVIENPPLPPKVVEAPRPNPVIPGGKIVLPKLPDKIDVPDKIDSSRDSVADDLDVPTNGLLDNSKVRQRPRKNPVRPPSKTNLNVDDDSKGPEPSPPIDKKLEDNTATGGGAPWQQETKNRKSRTNLPPTTPPVTTPTTPPVATPTKVGIPGIKPKPAKPSKPLPQTTPRPIVVPNNISGETNRAVSNSELPIVRTKSSESNKTSDIESSGEWKEAIELLRTDFQKFKEELRHDMRILTEDLDNERKKSAQLLIDVDRLKKTASFREKM